MSFSAFAIGVLFGVAPTPVRYWIGLGLAGNELRDAGYDRREVLRSKWMVRGDNATAVVGFGPFVNAVEFDQTLIYVERELIQRLQIEGGPVRLPPGALLDHSVMVTITDG